ncbi:F-box/kelch-repeat protein At3g06240-like [Papaver somniferum]|uniref:F-box/kelch-repeat protein At3g06240-like n=1 Tax=Papaver somniferum TaxID=3469 RepID=UPI000E701D9B|nr:F-box/kelch-repeat protein At3g06240-like [Papaver somniferum]
MRRFINRMDHYPSIFEDREIEFLCSCKGLVWISLTPRGWSKEFYIWNPSTEVYKNIPRPPFVDYEDVYGEIEGYGFCYDNKTDDYKLIRVLAEETSRCSNIDVYSLNLNSWRTIQGLPYYLYKRHSGVLFCGALHWLARTSGKYSTVLVRLDIIHERFEEIALPEAPMPYPEEPLEKNMFAIDVAVLGGCLCLVFRVFRVRVDIWMMQDYGVGESWTKSFSITVEDITNSWYLEVIWSFKNDEILWAVDRGLILYEPKNKTYKKTVLNSVTERGIIARNYTISSVSL